MNKRLNYGNFSLIYFVRKKKASQRRCHDNEIVWTDQGWATSVKHFLELIKNFDEVESLRIKQKEKYSEICGEILSTTYSLKDSDHEYQYDEESDKILVRTAQPN